MSGRHRRRKHLEQALKEVPTIEDGQTVARVVSLRGSNVVEVETPRCASHADADRVGSGGGVDVGPSGQGDDDAGSSCCLCLLPAKFSKRFWVKRGNFVVIEFTVEPDPAKKIKGTILHVLCEEQVRELRKQGGSVWPEEFAAVARSHDGASEPPDLGDGEEDDGMLDWARGNPNIRIVPSGYESSSESASSGPE